MLFTLIVALALIATVIVTVTVTTKTATTATVEPAAETAETAETAVEKWFAHDQETKSAYDVFESEDIEYRRVDDDGDWAIFKIKGMSLERRFGRYRMIAKVANYGNRCHIIYGVVE